MATPQNEIDKALRKPREENQFRYFLNVLLRRWPWLVAGTVLGSLAFGFVALAIERESVVYTAETELIVRPSRWEQGALRGTLTTSPWEGTPRDLVARIGQNGIRRDVARALVQQDISQGQNWGDVATEDDYRRAAAQVGSTLAIEALPDIGKIRVSCKGGTNFSLTSERDVKRVVELAARAFISRNEDYVHEEEQATLDDLRKELDRVRLGLESKESEEWRFRESMGFRDYEHIVRKMESWNEELVEAETEKEHMLSKMTQIEQELAAKNERLPAALGQVTDSVVNELVKDLDELLQEQLVMSIEFTDAYQPLQELKEDINDKKKAALQAIRQLDAGVEGGTTLWDQRKSLREQHMQIQLDLVTLDIRTATITRLLGELVEGLPALTEKYREHQRLVREVERLRTDFDLILDKELDIRTSLQRGSGQITRDSNVQVIRRLDSSHPSFNFLIGAAVGFVITFILAFMYELNDTSIHSIEEANQYIGLEVIGTIPRMRFGKGKGRRSRRRRNFVPITDEGQIHACIVTQHDPKSPISEAYRTLRTRFQLATIQDKPKTLVVTSAVPGEGKTTSAVNMAVTFADSGLRVLMVDTDLRRPNVHRVLRMERGPGLADILRDGLDPHSVIRPTRVENLWMISSGRVPPNPSELIGSDHMRRLMRGLGAEFDLVICDAPSILVVTDPVLLATDVDTVVLVVSVENARRETIVHAKKLLETANANIAGVVLNGLAASRRHYYYYYYYYDETAPQRQGKWYHHL